jgi:hypothetical protein
MPINSTSRMMENPYAISRSSREQIASDATGRMGHRFDLSSHHSNGGREHDRVVLRRSLPQKSGAKVSAELSSCPAEKVRVVCGKLLFLTKKRKGSP